MVHWFFSANLFSCHPEKYHFFFRHPSFRHPWISSKIFASPNCKKMARPLSPPLLIHIKIKLRPIHYPFLEPVTSILFANHKTFEKFSHRHQILKYFGQPFSPRTIFAKKVGMWKKTRGMVDKKVLDTKNSKWPKNLRSRNNRLGKI